jgi:hypothetical protein
MFRLIMVYFMYVCIYILYIIRKWEIFFKLNLFSTCIMCSRFKIAFETFDYVKSPLRHQ